MGDDVTFDAVVVGAGPAGSAAAITMAKKGVQVALLERGLKPGSKNVMGGILYSHYLEEIVGDEWKEAPLERPIIEERRWLMTPQAAIGIDYKNLRNREHPHSFSVLRARFDAWFAEQAEKAGAMADLGDPAWRGMVCVETGNVADNEVRLAADDEHQMSTVISVDAEP